MKPNIGQGDGGKTNLIGSDKKVFKSSSRIEACGALDELISLLGFITTSTKNKKIILFLEKIQDHLFRIETQVATDTKDIPGFPHIGPEHIKFLEESIRDYEKDLPELQNFILPGGTKLSALFHMARAETRRVERILVRANQKQKLHPHAIPYLNRLSDVFFALARWINHRAKIEEAKWIGLGKKDI